MKYIIDFLVSRSKHEHSLAARTLATFLGALLFLAGIPALVIWLGKFFLPQPILPLLPARILSGIFFLAGLPWLFCSIAWQLFKGKGTPVPLVPTQHFLQNGPYRFVRNPMMLGFFLYLLGWAWWRDQWGALVSAIAVEALLCAEIKYIEEPELFKRFGSAYQQYKQSTPFIIPRCRGCCSRAG